MKAGDPGAILTGGADALSSATKTASLTMGSARSPRLKAAKGSRRKDASRDVLVAALAATEVASLCATTADWIALKRARLTCSACHARTAAASSAATTP